MRRFTFSIAAGETKNFKISGNYLEIAAALYALNIEFYDREENQLSLQSLVQAVSGDWQAMDPGQQYGGFRVYSATAQTVTLFIGYGTGGSKRLPGIVEIVDSNYSLTLAGMAFIPYYGYTPAGGTVAHIQLLNPSGSGKVLEVQSLNVGLTGAGGIGVVLTTGLTLTNAAGANAYQAKRASGAAAGAGEVRYQDSATVLQATRQILGVTFGAAGTQFPPLRAPILLQPGDGVLVFGSTNLGLTAGAETVERTT